MKKPKGYKRLGHKIPGEPTFTIRAKDNFALPILKLLQPIYGISDDVIDWFERWRASNPQLCKDPD